MKALKKLVLSILLLIILAGNSIAFQIPQNSLKSLKRITDTEPVTKSTLEKTGVACFLAIENTISSQNISEVHRIAFGFDLPKRILPSKQNFRSLKVKADTEKLVSSIPIFIRGHALRH